MSLVPTTDTLSKILNVAKYAPEFVYNVKRFRDQYDRAPDPNLDEYVRRDKKRRQKMPRSKRGKVSSDLGYTPVLDHNNNLVGTGFPPIHNTTHKYSLRQHSGAGNISKVLEIHTAVTKDPIVDAVGNPMSLDEPRGHTLLKDIYSNFYVRGIAYKIHVIARETTKSYTLWVTTDNSANSGDNVITLKEARNSPYIRTKALSPLHEQGYRPYNHQTFRGYVNNVKQVVNETSQDTTAKHVLECDTATGLKTSNHSNSLPRLILHALDTYIDDDATPAQAGINDFFIEIDLKYYITYYNGKDADQANTIV